MVAWYVLSNESYMNRVISDVLPTARMNQHLCLFVGEIEGRRHTTLLAQEHKPVVN
jgi:hypothetical protein